jgi:hypothetical protein
MDTSNTMLEYSKRMDGLFKKILQNGYGNNKDYYKRNVKYDDQTQQSP